MKALIRTLLREALVTEILAKPENEIFSAYHGRYLFNVSMAYELISKRKIGFEIKKYAPMFLNQFSHSEFSSVDDTKLARLRDSIDYTKPLGLLVKFLNPEDQKTEWILIDGNHRVRVAGESDTAGFLYVIPNPTEVVGFMKINNEIPHEMFPDY